jgi:8-oxo-dGTP pyrophosphatase MutT (NUDIX family)
MERIGTCKELPVEYEVSDFKIDHAGYFSTLSYAVKGLLHRMNAIIRVKEKTREPYLAASFILPVDFERRETYLIRAPRHNRIFVRAGQHGEELTKRLLLQGSVPDAYIVAGDVLNVFDTAAGMIEPGETAVEAAIREGKEELGMDLDPSRLTHVGSLNGSIGLAAENLELFLYAIATRYESVSPPGDGDERIEVWRMSFEEAFKLLDDGLIPNAGGNALVARLKRLDLERRLSEVETRLALAEGHARRTHPYGHGC